jgi:hypothetical protein
VVAVIEAGEFVPQRVAACGALPVHNPIERLVPVGGLAIEQAVERIRILPPIRQGERQ